MILRTGRSVGRTIYRQVGPDPSKADVLIGVMDTPELAALIVAAVELAEADRAEKHCRDAYHFVASTGPSSRYTRQATEEWQAADRRRDAARDAFRAAREAVR